VCGVTRGLLWRGLGIVTTQIQNFIFRAQGWIHFGQVSYSILSLTDVSLRLPFSSIYRYTPMNIRIKATLHQQQLGTFKYNYNSRQKSLRDFVLLQFTVCCAEGYKTFLFRQRLVFIHTKSFFCVTVSCKDVTGNISPQRQDSNFQTTTFGQKVISGHKSQSGLDTSIYWLTDWLTISRNVTSTSMHDKFNTMYEAVGLITMFHIIHASCIFLDYFYRWDMVESFLPHCNRNCVAVRFIVKMYNAICLFMYH
jgi:hypothetical protein